MSAPAPRFVNLPNVITVARIAASPLIAWLPFAPNTASRLTAFVLYVVAAVTDYWDGHLARSRNLVTDFGRLLDPLADKLLLVATFVPMLWLMGATFPLLLPVGAVVRPAFPFETPLGLVTMPWWIAAVVLGREVAMTAFRQLAARRGVIIAAIGPAKWKAGFQAVWVGAAYFWFFASTLAARAGWDGERGWRAFALFNGVVGVATMAVAVALTVYSLWLYGRRYSGVLRGPAPGPVR